MSIASVVAQQKAVATQAATAAAAQTNTSAMTSLDGNFNDFLNMLMTQLQNQDPTSPMDTDTFTSELVQFSSVEQQIQTNTSLTSLIQLTQGSEMIQGSTMIGQPVTVQSTEIPLQDSKGTVNIMSPAAEKVSVSISNSAGVDIYDATVNATAGNNTFQWNGTNNSGQTVPDGLYSLVATGSNVGGGTSTLPFTVTGTATGVSSSGTTVQLQLGPLSVPFSSVTSVGDAATTAN
jgi:flagellar basal-body rod modification protein FlgD